MSGNFCHSISDHIPQFCLFTSFSSNEIENNEPFYHQDWSEFNHEDFILDYLDTDWNQLFERFDFDPGRCFNIFNNKVKVLVEQHVPTIKLTKHQIKTKLKPWITPGILKSISECDFYHCKFIKAKNAETKAKFHSSFKCNRNLILTLHRQSKLNDYSRYFKRHSNNMHKIWSGVLDLIFTESSKSASHISIYIGDTVTCSQFL